MFYYSEDFKLKNDNNEPYSLKEENGHRYKSHSAKINNGVFELFRANSNYFFLIPNINEFTLNTEVGFLEPADQVAWGFVFSYSEKYKSGKMLLFDYLKENNELTIKLMRITINKIVCESEILTKNVILSANEMYAIEAVMKAGKCYGKFHNIDFCFSTELDFGKVGINLYITGYKMQGGILFKNISLSSDENPTKTEIISKRKYVIPYYDGGSENYELELSVVKYYEGPYEVNYVLTGGAFSREQRDYQMPDTWTVQYDIFKNAYIRFYGKNSSEKLYLKNGDLFFSEQNRLGKLAEKAFGAEKMPYIGKFMLSNFEANSYFVFGYEHFRRLGNELQAGKREFVYNTNCELVYSGNPLSDDTLLFIDSITNKKIVDLLPKNAYDYENARIHAENNHYFFVNEDVKFFCTAGVKKNPNFYSIKLFLTDAFLSIVQELRPIQREDTPAFYQFGYKAEKLVINVGRLSQGVYHIKAEIYFGNEVVRTHYSAFEVIDPNNDILPQESAGLPFLISGEGCPPELEHNCPDPCIIKPDFNECHYLSALECQITISEKRRVWELLKPYKKKLLIWADARTLPEGKEYWDYPLSVRNADYMIVSPGKGVLLDIINPLWFKIGDVRDIYNDFRKKHPEYAEHLFVLEDKRDVSMEELAQCFNLCGEEWIQYYSERKNEITLKLYEDIRKLNKKIKFSHGGPYAQYGTNYWSAYGSKWRGASKKYGGKLVDGFYIFEDYPFVCEQQTYYSAWAMMSLMLYMPETKIMPELFYDFDPVCPDGYVFNANPPMGKTRVEPHQTVSQVYEYMYATPILKDGTFHYYNDNCFQFLQSYNSDSDKRFQAFLKGWGVYLKNKPLKPLLSAAFVAEFHPDDDRYDLAYNDKAVNNFCQAGECFIYEKLAEAGLPKGFMTNFNGIMSIENNMVDLLCIPSLYGTDKKIVDKLRRLSEKGVALFAVGIVEGLEDVFGVISNRMSAKVDKISSQDETEFITPHEAEFRYKSNGAEVLLYAISIDGNNRYPVLLKKGNAVLLNTSVCQVGCEKFMFETHGLANISSLLKRVCIDVLYAITSPLVIADKSCGINLFESERGEKMLMLTDYSSYDNTTKQRAVTVEFKNMSVRTVEFVGHEDDKIKINLLKKAGELLGFNVTIRQRESLLFKLN